MTRLLLLLGVSAVITGCASYGDVARLNRINQESLERLSKELGPNDTSKRIYAALGSSRSASLNALSAASLANVEAQARFSDPDARKIYLNAQTARLQTEFNNEAVDSARRADILKTLEGKFADAAKALHENGQDIQRYLDMDFFERVFTNVRGMNTTKLKQIGEDLRSLSERVTPGISGAIQGGSTP
jgi:hypothetical protein